MAHAFVFAGQAHEVWLSRSPSGYAVHVGTAVVPPVEAAHHVAVDGDDVHIHLDGGTYLLRFAHALDRHAPVAGEEGEAIARAPMPGNVVAVSAAAGDAVRRGQALVVIESMKMETTITAPCDGVVHEVHVAIGRTFDRDAALVTIERAPP